MDYERLQMFRMTATQIAPYDMITAVTQRAINKQLEKIHRVNPSLQKLSLLSTDPEDDYSRLEADLSAPTIELRLNTENRIVIFCLNITRATLKYLSIKGRKVLEESLEIPACTLALSVNLAFEGVNFADLPKDVQARLKVKNNYSVQQLLVDFTSASLARLDKKRTTVHNHIQDLTAKAFFDIFIEKYFTDLAEKNKFVLHYVPVATQDYRKQYAMPTVPPTDFTFQNLPFVQNALDKGGPSEDNMLVYIQMCNDHHMPTQLLATSANWVVPTASNADRYDGTVVLSADTFLNGWLLKKLAEFNKKSSWVVTEAWWKAKGFGAEFGLDGELGRNNATESELQWVPVNSAEVDQNIKEKVKSHVGRWYKYYFYNKKDDDEGAWRVWEKGTTTNWLHIPEGYNDEGKCEIFMHGTTEIDFYVHCDIPASTGWVKGEWSTKIIFDGVNDGEMIIKADDIKPKITSGADEALLNGGQITTFSEPTAEGLNKLSMTEVINDMRSVFKNGWDFVLPGGADFYISKAVFNREQDLMCELKYKFKA